MAVSVWAGAQCRAACAVLLLFRSPIAQAQEAASPERIEVVGAGPLSDGGSEQATLPLGTEILSDVDVAREQVPDLLEALATDATGIDLDSASGNPYQPTLYRDGFSVSPLQGTSQGIAVYVDAARFNEPFGDTVNWDLIPDNAIRRVVIEDADPVFGLNALGGSISVDLKDGFSAPGADLSVSGGSFGTAQIEAEDGIANGDTAFYAAGSVIHQDGWRDLQSTDIENLFLVEAIRFGTGTVRLDLRGSNSAIAGPGTAPVQLLAADPAAQFTAPNSIFDRSIAPSIRIDDDITRTVSLQADVHAGYFQQRVVNGNAPNDAPCTDDDALLCQTPGAPSTTRGGGPIPAFLGEDPQRYSELDDQTTNTNAAGAGVQLTSTARVLGRPNHLVVGTSIDSADTEFSATSLIGGITPVTRVFAGPGIPIDEPGVNQPVRVAIDDLDAAGYASDTLALTGALAVTGSARFDFATVDLHDQGGGDLSGRHSYARFNPAIGVTYRITPYLSLYGGLADSSRAPTPAELSCAGPQDSCSLANFFVGDPDLKQVVAHTWRVGLRGHMPLRAAGSLQWQLGLFRTDVDDDIVFIDSNTQGRAFFANIGQTRRQGVSARIDEKIGAVSAYVDESYVDATYGTGFTEAAGDNPDADANGDIQIRRGDALPGIPRNTLKVGLDVDATARLRLGGDGEYQSGQVLFGDEANLTGRLPPFLVVNLHASYEVTKRVRLFAYVRNALDRRYETFGTFSPTGAVFLAQAPGATNPRSYSLAAPIGCFGGVRVAL